MLDVPFRSQRELADCRLGSSLWADRACAIACLTMVLQHIGRVVPMADVLARALACGAFDPKRGWLHAGLVGVAQSFGAVAYRRNWRLLDDGAIRYLAGRALTPTTHHEIALVRQQMIEEGLRTIDLLLASGVPVIASVYRPWDDRDSVGHQIVLVGRTADGFIHHDPVDADGAFRDVAAEVFVRSWKGLAIVAHTETR